MKTLCISLHWAGQENAWQKPLRPKRPTFRVKLLKMLVIQTFYGRCLNMKSSYYKGSEAKQQKWLIALKESCVLRAEKTASCCIRFNSSKNKTKSGESRKPRNDLLCCRIQYYSYTFFYWLAVAWIGPYLAAGDPSHEARDWKSKPLVKNICWVEFVWFPVQSVII